MHGEAMGTKRGGPNVSIEPEWPKRVYRTRLGVVGALSLETGQASHRFAIHFFVGPIYAQKKVTSIVHLASEHASTKLMCHLCTKAGHERSAHVERLLLLS